VACKTKYAYYLIKKVWRQQSEAVEIMRITVLAALGKTKFNTGNVRSLNLVVLKVMNFKVTKRPLYP
jgi:transcriptional regulator with PAS, ATPase and Fis domain